MQSFWEIVASNALLVVVVAAGVALLGRVWKNPLCLHLLWVLVLVKLVTPPMVTVPVVLPARPVPLASASEDRADSPGNVTPLRVEVAGHETASGQEPDFVAIGREQARLVEDLPVPERPAATDGVAASSIAKADSSVAADTRTVAVPREIPWLTILAWTWGMGIVLFASRHAWRILRFKSLLHSGETPSSAVIGMAEMVAKRLGLRRVPRIDMLPVRVSPLVWSLGGRARVFLPAALFERLDRAAL